MKDFRINWQLPAQPLGTVVRVGPKKEEDPCSSFQTESRDWVIDPSFTETKKFSDFAVSPAERIGAAEVHAAPPQWIPWDPTSGATPPRGALRVRLRCGETRRADTIFSWGCERVHPDYRVVAYSMEHA